MLELAFYVTYLSVRSILTVLDYPVVINREDSQHVVAGMGVFKKRLKWVVAHDDPVESSPPGHTAAFSLQRFLTFLILFSH